MENMQRVALICAENNQILPEQEETYENFINSIIGYYTILCGLYDNLFIMYKIDFNRIPELKAKLDANLK